MLRQLFRRHSKIYIYDPIKYMHIPMLCAQIRCKIRQVEACKFVFFLHCCICSKTSYCAALILGLNMNHCSGQKGIQAKLPTVAYRGSLPNATFGSGKNSHQPKFALANAFYGLIISLLQFFLYFAYSIKIAVMK